MTRRLNVMHLVYSLEAGGMENGVVNLCNRLDPEQFAPSICVMHAGGPLEANLDPQRVQLVEVRRHFGNDPSVPFRLAWAFRRCRVDILHTHSWVTLVEGSVGAAMARVPRMIHGEHGYPMEERPRNVRIQRWLWRRASQLTSVAAELADSMSRLTGIERERIEVISNGVDTRRFRPQVMAADDRRRQFGLPPDGLVIGIVARLTDVKNHQGAIRAVASLRGRGVQVHLAIAGDGELCSKLQQLACELGIEEQVHFLGHVVDVEKIYHAFDIFLLNSHREGMSNTIIEAMACGIPVIATRVGANAESVVDGVTGFLVPAGELEPLVAAIGQLTSAPLRHRLGAAARKRIEEDFSMDGMVRRYSDLYLRLHPRKNTMDKSASTYAPRFSD